MNIKLRKVLYWLSRKIVVAAWIASIVVLFSVAIFAIVTINEPSSTKFSLGVKDLHPDVRFFYALAFIFVVCFGLILIFAGLHRDPSHHWVDRVMRLQLSILGVGAFVAFSSTTDGLFGSIAGIEIHLQTIGIYCILAGFPYVFIKLGKETLNHLERVEP